MTTIHDPRLTINGRDWTNRAGGTWSVSWGRNSGREHAAPGQIRGTIIVTDNDLISGAIRYEHELVLFVRVDGAEVCIARGWITSWTRRRFGAKWLLQLRVTDILGILTATNVNPPDLPAQSIAARLQAVTAISPIPDPISLPEITWNVTDSPTPRRLVKLIDLFQDITKPSVTVVEARHCARYQSQLGPMVVLTAWGLTVIRPAVWIPATAVHDGDRVLDRRAMLTGMTIKAASTDEPVRTWSRPDYRSTSDFSLSTDWAPTTEEWAGIGWWVKRVLGASREIYERIENMTIRLDDIDDADIVAAFIDINRRADMVFRLNNPPDDLARIDGWYPHHGALTLTARPTRPGHAVECDTRFEVGVEPAAWIGMTAARFEEFTTAEYLAGQCRISDLDLTYDPTAWLGGGPATWQYFPPQARYADHPNLKIHDLNAITGG